MTILPIRIEFSNTWTSAYGTFHKFDVTYVTDDGEKTACYSCKDESHPKMVLGKKTEVSEEERKWVDKNTGEMCSEWIIKTGRLNTERIKKSDKVDQILEIVTDIQYKVNNQ